MIITLCIHEGSVQYSHTIYIHKGSMISTCLRTTDNKLFTFCKAAELIITFQVSEPGSIESLHVCKSSCFFLSEVQLFETPGKKTDNAYLTTFNLRSFMKIF